MQESKYLIVNNIPSLGAHNDLLKLFKIYGNILEYKMLDEYPSKEYCETMLIKYEKIQNARYHCKISILKVFNYSFKE